MPEKKREDKIVWLDLEMTGLDPEKNEILEMASIVTDGHLNIIAEGPSLVFMAQENTLLSMDDWNRSHHKKSGLWDLARRSTISVRDGELTTLAFLKQFVGAKAAPLGGNSIWQDRRFIARYMPELDQFLHYRLIDVSTIKELAARWYPQQPAFEKKNAHRAIDDIKESIEELKYYQKTYFQQI